MNGDRETLRRLVDVQDVEVNYYVLVPFSTAVAAEWAADHYIGEKFDCHVVSVAAVDQNALVVADVRACSDGDQAVAPKDSEISARG